MQRKLVASLVAAWIVVWVSPAAPAQDAKAQPVDMKVLVPQDDAKLWINDTPTRQRGDERQFVSSPLKPGKNYYYVLRVMWEPNNYTKIFRSRKVFVKPGDKLTVDLRKREPKDAPDDIKVRYVPTPNEVVDKMIEMGNVGKDDVVFDLGCGDGRLVCRAVANKKATRGVGVDIDPERIKDSIATAKQYGVEDKVKFREGDVLKQIDDLAEASVVLLYMGDDINLRLRPILRKTLKPGSRVVSHRFTMGDWEPDKTVKMTHDGEEYLLHLWTITEKDKTAEDGKGEKKSGKGEEKEKEKEKAKP